MKNRQRSCGPIGTFGIIAGLLVATGAARLHAALPPVGTAITFQGQLKQNGVPQTGSVDLVFTLFKEAVGGVALPGVPVLPFNNVGVVNGLFTQELDFGASAFGGNARWVEIQVRSPHDPMGTGPFTTLAPRPAVTPAPYALTATKVVPGSITPDQIQSSNIPADGLSLRYFGGGFEWAVLSGSNPWQSSGGDIYYNGGNVGIGTSTPGVLLEVTTPEFDRHAIMAQHTSADGVLPAIEGISSSDDNLAAGVIGRLASPAPGDFAAGVIGVSDSLDFRGIGVWGIHFQQGIGVYGSSGPGGYGVFGAALGVGVGANGIGAGARGVDATGEIGVKGTSTQSGTGGIGVLGLGDIGVSAVGNHYGVHGVTEPTRQGSASVYGVYGEATETAGFFGASKTYGVYGIASNSGFFGEAYGVYGEATGRGAGVFGKASASPLSVGIVGTSPGPGILAGYFGGPVEVEENLHVNGMLSKNGGMFHIDHPLDPENKYLNHSFVESPDMKNIYDGNVTTDARGYATIKLPDYFEALNQDFRYQLTMLDETDSPDFVVAKVVQKTRNNQFTIRTNQPNSEVSWQVTGIRKDAWAQRHRIVVEEEKAAPDRGKFLHPELCGRSDELRIGRLEWTVPTAEPSETPK